MSDGNNNPQRRREDQQNLQGQEPDVIKDPIHGVAYLITIIFVVAIGGTLIASIWNPHIDVAFIIQMTMSVMGFASFLTLHFGQRRINQRVNMIPCQKDQEKIAEKLEVKTKEITEQQTAKIAEKIDKAAADSVTRGDSINMNNPRSQ